MSLTGKFLGAIERLRQLAQGGRYTHTTAQGGWQIPLQPSYYIRPRVGSDIPVYRARYRPTSKYDAQGRLV